MQKFTEFKTAIRRLPIVGPMIYSAYKALQAEASVPAQEVEMEPQTSTPPKPDWSDAANILPWFDQPNALEVLEKRKATGEVSASDYELLKKWIVDGYVILDTEPVPMADIDGMVSDLENLFTTNEPKQGLLLLTVSRTEGGPTEAMPHAELLTLPKEIREKIPTNSNWRIHEFHAWSKSADNIFKNAELERVCSLIFGKKAYARSTINFMYGSQQLVHQDMAVFHIFPHNYLIGMWLACEEIHPESGPLVYYPGSHKMGMWEGFKNYPQTQLRTCTKPENEAYHKWTQTEAEKHYPRKEFIAKKGQVLLWHGGLVHGGSAIKRKGLTRKSFVTHYLVDGVDHTPHVKGPFNWD